MQLTTIEQLKNVQVNDTLFLINPFGNDNQSNVCIEAFTVHDIDEEKFNGRSQFIGSDCDHLDVNFFVSMLGRCKSVYTQLSEANEQLDRVHKGLHAATVKAHHDSCKELFDFRDDLIEEK